MKLLEYLRLGRVYNAHILGIIMILSYLLTAWMYDVTPEIHIIIVLFISGICMHIWGCYQNDLFDFALDEKAVYCSNKPLINGTIPLKNAWIISFVIGAIPATLFLIFGNTNVLITTSCAFATAFFYNKYNKSSMIINILGQFYASFVVLIGMSFIVEFDWIIFCTALVYGLNGVHLNIIEADLKDIKGDIVNVPKALGMKVVNNKFMKAETFILLSFALKASISVLVAMVLILTDASWTFKWVALGFIFTNLGIRMAFFAQMYMGKLSSNREKLKPWIAAQELTAVIFISSMYMVVNPWIPLFVISFTAVWLIGWCYILWGKPVPQV